jgi:hypothetical protein
VISPRIQKTGVALTFFVGLFFLGYYTTYLAWEDLKPWRTYKVRFGRTLGLAKDDDVYVYGYKIGRVHRIDFEGDHQLAQIQVDPGVHFHTDGLRVVIEPTDSFGTVGVFVTPGDPRSAEWDPATPIAGTFRESLAAGGSEGTSASTLTTTLNDLEEMTDTLARSDTGLSGKLLNDPDAALVFRDVFARLGATVTAAAEISRETVAEEGPGTLIARDPAAALEDTTQGLKDTLGAVSDGLKDATHGEGGMTGRLLGDRDAADSLRDTVAWTSGVLADYQTGDATGFFGAATHSPDPAERYSGFLAALSGDSADGRYGEGQLGPLFGPDSGATVPGTLAELQKTLESMVDADPGTGSLLSPSPEGRRATEDLLNRVDNVLRDMRNALARVRSDQAPNTFPGALLSVF